MVVVQPLSHVWLFANPWTAACQASLSFTIFWSFSKSCPLNWYAIQPSHPLLHSSPPALNPSQHQGLFQWVGYLHQMTKILELQLQHSSFQLIQGWSPIRLTGLISLLSKGLSAIFSSTTARRYQFFSALPSLWSSSHNRTWPLGRPYPSLYGPWSAK